MSTPRGCCLEGGSVKGMFAPCGQVPCSSGNSMDRVIWKSAIPAGQIFAIVVGQPSMLTVGRFREVLSVDMVVTIPLALPPPKTPVPSQRYLMSIKAN